MTPPGQYIFSLDADEPTVVLTPKGRNTARALAQKPTAASHNTAASAATSSPNAAVKHVRRAASQASQAS